jgi:hypothetical protein
MDRTVAARTGEVLMLSTLKLGLCVPAALVATLGLPSAASSQYRLPTITASAVAQADRLHDSAILLAEKNRWRDAARLHRESAALRAPEDSLGFRCLRAAANLSFVDDDLPSAQRDIIAAAEQARARGDVENAALSYADAAWVANQRKRPAEMWTLGRQATVLASSPLLSPAQRDNILQRFVQADAEVAVQNTR